MDSSGTLDPRELQRAEFLKHANEMITKKLYQVLNKENNNARPESNMRNFFYYLGPGNNAKTV